MTVRVWNILALAALSRPDGAASALLFEHFLTFSFAYSQSLSPYQSVQGLDHPDAQDRAHADLSYAYAAIKLWLLLSRKAASGHPGVDATGALQDGEGLAAKMVWNELWPPFEIVIAAFEIDARAGNVSVSHILQIVCVVAMILSWSLSRWHRACGRRLQTCSSSSGSHVLSSRWTHRP